MGGGASEIHGMKKGEHKSAGSFINAAIAEGKYSNKQIAEAASSFFGTKTTSASISWYKYQIKKVTPEYKAYLAEKKKNVAANNKTIEEVAKNPPTVQELKKEHEQEPAKTHTVFVSLASTSGSKSDTFVKVTGVPGNTPGIIAEVKKMVQNAYPGKFVNNAGEFNPNNPAPNGHVEETKLDKEAAADIENKAYAAAEAKAEAEKKAAEEAAKKNQYTASTYGITTDYKKPLTDAQKQALKNYTNGSYNHLNKKLRSGQPLDTGQAHLAFAMDQALKNSSFTKDGVVYRGIANPTAFFGPEIKKGTIVLDNGYLSTSKNYSTASGFSGGGFSGGGMIARILVKAGDPGLDVSGFSLHSGEHEVVLPRGSMFIVKDIIGKIVECEYVAN